MYLQKSEKYFAFVDSAKKLATYADKRTHFLGAKWLGLLKTAASTKAASITEQVRLWHIFQDKVDVYYLLMYFKDRVFKLHNTTPKKADLEAFESLVSPYIDTQTPSQTALPYCAGVAGSAGGKDYATRDEYTSATDNNNFRVDKTKD